MIKKTLLTCTLGVFFLLSGCGTPTTYHAYDGTDGYSSIQLNKTLYEVSFSGNTLTDKDQVRKMLLYRAAEISNNNGYPYFRVVSEKTKKHKDSYVTPGYASTTVSSDDWGDKIKSTRWTPASETVYTSYTLVMKIQLLKQNSNASNVYEAYTLHKSLQSQITWPPKPTS